MSTRSSLIKKRHGIGRAVKRGRRLMQFTPMRVKRLPRLQIPINPRVMRGLGFRLCVFVGLFLLILGGWQLFRPGVRIRVNADLVAAFQVPHRAIGLLSDYATQQDIHFATLFTIFMAENDFFPDKAIIHDLRAIEALYVTDFERLKRRYHAPSLAPYVTMFENLFAELEVFPIPDGWYVDEASIMFGDTWGIDHNVQGNRMHMGTAIVDRENIRGRVPIVSMTHGRVEEAGWNNQLGYFVGITTMNGTYYLYAHLDSLILGLHSGQLIQAGQPLGYMGNSGGGRGGGNFAVHLHVGISPEVDFTRGRFWINPYPFLRFLYDG